MTEGESSNTPAWEIADFSFALDRSRFIEDVSTGGFPARYEPSV